MSYEKLYRAQVKMHEATNEALRKAEKENANLRGILQMERENQTKYYERVKTFIHEIQKLGNFT